MKSADDSRLHLVVIPREVLEDDVHSTNADPLDNARAHRNAINKAVVRAWHPDRLREMFEISGTGLRDVQLWLTREDFS